MDGLQAVGHVRDRAGVPEGTYRLHIEGKRYLGEDTTWPWSTEPYTLSSDPFEVVPAEIDLALGDGFVTASLQGPEDGYRLVDIDGYSRGANPLRGDLEVVWLTAQDSITETVAAPAPTDQRTVLSFPPDATVLGVTITDAYGNTGSIQPTSTASARQARAPGSPAQTPQTRQGTGTERRRALVWTALEGASTYGPRGERPSAPSTRAVARRAHPQGGGACRGQAVVRRRRMPTRPISASVPPSRPPGLPWAQPLQPVSGSG